MPSKAVTVNGAGVSAVTGVLRAMFDRVLSAAAVPGLFLAVLIVVAFTIPFQDVRRRDHVRRFSRQQRVRS